MKLRVLGRHGLPSVLAAGCLAEIVSEHSVSRRSVLRTGVIEPAAETVMLEMEIAYAAIHGNISRLHQRYPAGAWHDDAARELTCRYRGVSLKCLRLLGLSWMLQGMLEGNHTALGTVMVVTALGAGALSSCRATSGATDSAAPVARDTASSVRAVSLLAVAPSTMASIGTVDERYQSYNIEMLEVTGGKYWKPYGLAQEGEHRPPARSAASSAAGIPVGMDPALYRYRPPLDLTNTRLRKLAAALGPAYVRVSGTWANASHFVDSDRVPKARTHGFWEVVTRRQWKGVVDFAKETNAEIVTSFATSPGTRDALGVWTPRQARRLLAYTKSLRSRIAAAEFMNEPNFAAMGGAPAGYDAAAYGRDFKVFRDFVELEAPDMLILGPGSIGEKTGGVEVAYDGAPVLKTRDLLLAAGPGIDVFSYHHYGASSQRCAAMGTRFQTTAHAALSEDWLNRTDETLAFYRKLRDDFEPGRPLWLTETADAACGGNPWAGTFLDTFRYLDQLGRLAKQGVQVVAHNTLVASDFGLLDSRTLAPKPNYWGAILWRKLMGTTALESGVPNTTDPKFHAARACTWGAMLLSR